MNQADSSVTTVQLLSAFASGQYVTSPYYQSESTGFGLQWVYNNGTTISATSNVEISINS